MGLKGLYAITDEILTPDNMVLEYAREALNAGVKILQYRNKTKTDDEIKEICISLLSLCREYDALFIIDDRVKLAKEIGADGVHIGEDDISLKEARTILKDALIGVSCYGDIKNAIKAQDDGADYVAFGSFFASATKPHSSIVPLSVLKRAKEVLDIPICAIGGISSENIEQVMEHNPDMISVISAIFDGDITKNTTNLLKKMSI